MTNFSLVEGMRDCLIYGCRELLLDPDHELCLRHWKASRDGRLDQCAKCGGLFERDLLHCLKCGPIDRTFGDKRPSQPGTFRAADGHLVRSRGELLIDNWLYTAGLPHAYERRLPIEDEAYCDFWIPIGKVYIEYWGLDGNADYDARRQKKLALYREHGFELIEIFNEDIEHLDDILPPKLIRHGCLK